MRLSDQAAECLDDTNLLMQFESLGDNCEFGVVQRCCGAEPLGLFRFSSSCIANMIDVITSSGERLYSLDDLQLYREESLNEYCFVSRHYQDFHLHSQVDAGSISEDVMRVKGSAKLSYLKGRFTADLEAGEKIFVRKGSESLDAIRSLHAALGTHGANWLLWVVPANGDNPAGSVDVLQPGLLRGHVARFKNFETDQPVDLISWVMICRKAYALFQAARNRRPVFGSNKPCMEGTEWIFDSLCEVEHRIAAPSAHRAIAATRLTLTRDTQGLEPVATQAMICAAQPREILVFSAWIWIDDRFEGARIDVSLAPWSELVSQMADFSKRSCWQVIWVSARVPRGGGPIVAKMRAGSTEGSIFHVSAWRLEHGTIPSPMKIPSPMARPVGRSRGVFLPSVERLASRMAGVFKPKDAAAPLGEVAKGGRAWCLFVAAAEARIESRRFDDADRVMRQALAAWPGDHDLLRLYAWSAHVSARYAQAIERWRVALAAAPEDPLCHGALAANLREHGALEAAEAAIQAALPAFPDEIIIVTEAGRIAQAHGRHDQALAHWDKALALAPPHPDWLRCRAQALRALEDQRSAETRPPI